MRLTLALFKRKKPPGNMWIGKHRLAHHIYPMNVQLMARRLNIEEQNMLLLRNPYLTLEQEREAQKVLHNPEEAKVQRKLMQTAKTMLPSVRFEKTLNHLLHNDKWDV